jgi:hypothetical protein
VCSAVLTENFQRKSIKSHTKPIKMQIFLSFIGFVCELTVKTTEHTVASYMKAVISHENF